jgi:hypothetical protein
MVVVEIAKEGSLWGQIHTGKPLFTEGFDLLVAKADCDQILA